MSLNRAEAEGVVASLTRLSAVFRQPLNEVELGAYVEVLLPYGSGAVAKACTDLMGDPDATPFMPKPPELVARIVGSRKRKAMVAWTKFRGGISRYAGRTVAFDDPLIHHFAAVSGGWARLGLMQTYALDQLRAEFLETYMAALVEPPDAVSVPKRLVGEDRCEEGRAIVIGDKVRGLEVLRGDLQAAIEAVTQLPKPQAALAGRAPVALGVRP